VFIFRELIYRCLSEDQAFVKNKYYRVYGEEGKAPIYCRAARST
jgi:hypothetical protein